MINKKMFSVLIEDASLNDIREMKEMLEAKKLWWIQHLKQYDESACQEVMQNDLVNETAENLKYKIN